MFPGRIETERLLLERTSPETVDTFAPCGFYGQGAVEGTFEYRDSSPTGR